MENIAVFAIFKKRTKTKTHKPLDTIVKSTAGG